MKAAQAFPEYTYKLRNEHKNCILMSFFIAKNIRPVVRFHMFDSVIHLVLLRRASTVANCAFYLHRCVAIALKHGKRKQLLLKEKEDP